MAERAEDFQVEVLRAFSVLCALAEDLGRTDWAGALMVGCGLGPGGSALALAGKLAGAGCLAIEARAAVCRAALRSVACDFVVNSVDEALRILKNEIRQRRPVSVGLAMEPNAALTELMERGVLPRSSRRLVRRGTRAARLRTMSLRGSRPRRIPLRGGLRSLGRWLWTSMDRWRRRRASWMLRRGWRATRGSAG